MSATWQRFEDDNRLWGVAHRSKDRCHHRAVRMEELFKLKMFNEVELVDLSSVGDSPCACYQMCAARKLVQPETGVLHSETQTDPKLTMMYKFSDKTHIQ